MGANDGSLAEDKFQMPTLGAFCWTARSQRSHAASSPPPVDSNVGRSCKPGVKDIHTTNSVRSLDGLSEGRIVVEPQALPEPVDRIYDHYFTGQVP